MAKAGVWEAVGDTPLLKIESLSKLTGCEILAKAEFLNPGGSVKDRAAKGIIARAEHDGLLSLGGTIVEGTAGNTGIGLTTLAAARGYRCIISMPDNQAPEKYQMLSALGAEIRPVPAVPFSNPNHFYHRAKAIAETLPGAFWANQFENPANSEIHYETTGAEILAQAGGRINVFVCAVGTGGTIGGVSRRLKEENADTRIVVADPPGSGLYCQLKEGIMIGAGSSITEGIGIMRLTANFLSAHIDDAIRVTDQEMIDMLYYLARHEGLVVGSSSALNVMAAFRLALATRGSGQRIVTILCDHGSRYASRIFNASWLSAKGLHPNPESINKIATIKQAL